MGAFRRSELGGLNLEHIELTDAALILSLPKSKANQAGGLEQKAVFYASNPFVLPYSRRQGAGRNAGRTH